MFVQVSHGAVLKSVAACIALFQVVNFLGRSERLASSKRNAQRNRVENELA
jgi:hypothetical protein